MDDNFVIQLGFVVTVAIPLLILIGMTILPKQEN